jgi:hypothetical protein
MARMRRDVFGSAVKRLADNSKRRACVMTPLSTEALIFQEAFDQIGKRRWGRPARRNG